MKWEQFFELNPPSLGTEAVPQESQDCLLVLTAFRIRPEASLPVYQLESPVFHDARVPAREKALLARTHLNDLLAAHAFV